MTGREVGISLLNPLCKNVTPVAPSPTHPVTVKKYLELKNYIVRSKDSEAINFNTC